MGTNPRTAFTLRFERAATHETLRLCASELGISMSNLAERLIEQQLRLVATTIETTLTETLTALRSYTGEDLKKDLEVFAHAEGEYDDPLQTRLASLEVADPYGVSALFASRVE